jgi:hypothetical protein
MEFMVDLRPEEYQRAMLWHQFSGTVGKRINELVSWLVLILTPLTIVLLLWLAPDALSIWFWPVAIVAVSYAVYSTIVVRYQIRKQAEMLLAEKPALLQTRYRVHEKGVKLAAMAEGGSDETLFIPWKEIERIDEVANLYLLFVSEDNILIIPKRSLPDETAFRLLLQQVDKLR